MHEFGHIWEGHEENPIVYILEVLHATPNLKKNLYTKIKSLNSVLELSMKMDTVRKIALSTRLSSTVTLFNL